MATTSFTTASRACTGPRCPTRSGFIAAVLPSLPPPTPSSLLLSYPACYLPSSSCASLSSALPSFPSAFPLPSVPPSLSIQCCSRMAVSAEELCRAVSCLSLCASRGADDESVAPLQFLRTLDKHAAERAFNFAGAHFFEVGLWTMMGNYNKLASTMVHLLPPGAKVPPASETIAELKRRLRPVIVKEA